MLLTLTQGRMCVIMMVSLLSSVKFSQNSDDEKNEMRDVSISKFQQLIQIVLGFQYKF